MSERLMDNSSEYEIYSDEWLAELYLKFGSVDELVKKHQGYIPRSYPTIHRAIVSRGLVKSPGRHVPLSEVLSFFKEKALVPGTPVEKLYRSMPPSFTTSIHSLYRISNAIEKKVIRRKATAVVISHPYNDNLILVGDEKHKNTSIGKSEGDTSVLTTFSAKNETPEDSMLRVLQSEFSTQLAVRGELSAEHPLAKSFIGENTKPFMYLDIVDVRVGVYKVTCPEELSDLTTCSSFKIENHRFERVDDVLQMENIRTGVAEVALKYKELTVSPEPEYQVKPAYVLSDLNHRLLAYATAS